MTWIDLEQRVFLAIFHSYVFWFFPPKPVRFVRWLGNCLLVVHFAAVAIVGTVLAKDIYTNIRPSSGSAPDFSQQVIVNTGRLDRLEDDEKIATALMAEMVKANSELRLQVGLVQQELFLYRWGLGIIYVVLVGQLGVAVFSLLMRRESDRQNNRESNYYEKAGD